MVTLPISGTNVDGIEFVIQIQRKSPHLMFSSCPDNGKGVRHSLASRYFSQFVKQLWGQLIQKLSADDRFQSSTVWRLAQSSFSLCYPSLNSF